MVEKGVMTPILLEDIPHSDRPKILRSFHFITVKKDANGDVEKVKSRMVACGNQQRRNNAITYASPTGKIESVFTTLQVAITMGWFVRVIDVACAYLNAYLPEQEVIYLKLGQAITKKLVELQPQHSSYMDKSGCMITKLNKALYGLIQSAQLWYQNIRGTLKDMGFHELEETDKCTFVKMHANKPASIIVLYVDDLLMTASSEELLDQVEKELIRKYGKLTVQRPPIIKYLGMRLVVDYENRCITLDNIKDMKEIIQQENIVKTRKTPMDDSLRSRKTGDVQLLPPEKAARFRSLVHKLMYYGKRTRPDITAAIAFLSTSVSNPNELDDKALTQVLEYINGSINLGLTFRPGQLAVRAYADAAFDVHPKDSKSHSGGIIYLSDVSTAPVSVISRKQSFRASSTRDAEAGAVADVANEVKWFKNHLKGLGIPNVKAYIRNDNLPLLQTVDGQEYQFKTKCLQRKTRDIIDDVRNGEYSLSYQNTKDLIADTFTKALSYPVFCNFRDRFMTPMPYG